MARYVYASSIAAHGGKLFLYRNARNVANPLRGRESIGLAIAEI